MTEEQRQKKRDYKRLTDERHRAKAYEILGNKCAHCGNTDKRVFTIDHIVPILRRTKNELHSGSDLRRKVVNGTLTSKDVQILCANCHIVKTEIDREGFLYASKR